MKTPDKVIIEVTGDAIAVRVYSEGDVVSFHDAGSLSRNYIEPMLNRIKLDIGNYHYLSDTVASTTKAASDISEALRDLR